MSDQAPCVLQICHTSKPPFADVARQWRVLFDDTPYRVVTVFLCGAEDEEVANLVGGDVIFMGYQSRDLRGLKRRQIADIRRLHRRYRFRLLIGHRYKPIFIAAHIPRVPLIAVSHGYGVYDGFFRRRFIRRQASRSLLLGVSDAVRDEVRNKLKRFPRDRVQTLYNHVDLDRLRAGQYSRGEARQRLGLPEDGPIVGNVGRLHPHKDQATLIAAYARAAQSRDYAALAIIGTGTQESALREQARDLGLADQLYLLGWVPDAWRYFRAFDVFALSSRREGFGMVLLEAMAAEVPVVCSRVGGAPEVVGANGRLFPPGDVDALARLLREKVDAQQRDAALERVARYFSDTAARAEFWRQLEASDLLS